MLPPIPAEKPMLQSQLSTRSLGTVSTLLELEAELKEMQATHMAAADGIAAASQGGPPVPLSLRGELCSLHGSANKMLATRVDAIMTGDLMSGKDEARARRKALVLETERLIEQLEVQIKEIDGLKTEGSSIVEGSAANVAEAGGGGQSAEERC